MKRCLMFVLALAACPAALAAPPATGQGAGRDAPVLDFSATAYPQSDFPGVPGSSSTVRLAASLTKSLPRDWLVRASINTQYSPGEPSLQDSLAPAPTAALRLMANRDVLRDGGLGSNLELYSPNLCAGVLRKCRALVFYDRNSFRYNRATNGELRTRNVGSLGAGVRMQLDRRMSLQLDYGRVLRSDIMPDDARNRLTLRYGVTW
jgi:hemolysin activation/secretion protein